MKASISLTIKQGDFTFENQFVNNKDIDFETGFRFVTNAFLQQVGIQKIIHKSNTKKRPKFSLPFEITLNTSDGETYSQAIKLSLPKGIEESEGFAKKLMIILGVTCLNSADADFRHNYFSLIEGRNPAFPLVSAE